jgi:hypothetical protein
VRRIWAALAVLTLVGGLTACGDDDDTATDDTATTTDGGTTDDGGTDDTITDDAMTGDDGTTTGASGEAPTGEACELLTEADIESVLTGYDVRSAQDEGETLCSYSSTVPFAVATLTIERDELSDQSFDEAVEGLAGFTGETPEPVDDLDVEAARIGGSTPAVFLARGDDVVALVLATEDGDDEEAHLELARLVAARL